MKSINLERTIEHLRKSSQCRQLDIHNWLPTLGMCGPSTPPPPQSIEMFHKAASETFALDPKYSLPTTGLDVPTAAAGAREDR